MQPDNKNTYQYGFSGQLMSGCREQRNITRLNSEAL